VLTEYETQKAKNLRDVLVSLLNEYSLKRRKIMATNNDQKDLGTQGKEDTLKGKLKEAAGKVQSKVGQVTGNEEMEAKGDAKQVSGKVQTTGGKVEQKVDHALNPDKTDQADNH
jgi:uncharacterized protein YjbJ (UPF0337 family)